MRPRPRTNVLHNQRRLIDALAPTKAKQLLDTLLDARPELLTEAAALVDRELGAVSVQQLADQVARAVGALSIEDVWARSGRQPDGGYVEETEAAWIVLEDALEPFLENVVRRIRLGREQEALVICQGLLLALQRIEQTHGEDFLDGRGSDLIREAAGWAINTWRKGGNARPRQARDRPAMRSFVSEALPGWRSFLIRSI